MVKRAWLTSILLLAAVSAHADDYRLWLELPDVPDGQVELGQPFSVLLWYRGPADLDGIVSAPWQHDFAVTRGYASRIDGVQRLRLRLTPRHTGTLTLPPLHLGSAVSRARALTGIPAREGGTTLVPEWSVGATSPWQRQEFAVSLTLATADPDARLAVDDLAPDGFRAQALPDQVQPLADGRRLHRFAWLLKASRAGAVRLVLPQLSYIRDGVPRRRFQFPLVDLAVRALPPYVTPSVPVGVVRLDRHDGSRVYGLGIGANTLLAALARAGLPGEAAEQRTPEDGTRSEARVDWAKAHPTEAGVVYFEPGAGRLRALTPRPPGWAGWYASGSVLALLLGLAAWRRRELRRRWAVWRYRRRLRRALAKATDDAARTRALLALPLPGEPSPPRTLRRWAHDYGELCGLSAARRAALAAATTALEERRYGTAGGSPDGSNLHAAL